MFVRTPADLGAAIRERRRRLGLDQKAPAERVGVSRQWIIEAKHGKPRAEVGLVLRTLEALGLTLALDDGTMPLGDAFSPPPDIDAIVARARRKGP